jgi:hypothetical protein
MRHSFALLLLTASCAAQAQPSSGAALGPASQRDVRSSVAEIPRAKAPAPASAPAPSATKEEPKPPPSPGEAATAACIEESKLSRCLTLFGKTVDDVDSEEVKLGAACTSTCIGARDDRLAQVLTDAASACKDAYVKSRGHKPVACKLPKAPRLRDPRELSMRFQDALRAAVEKRDAASARALDAMLPRLDAAYLAAAEPECTENCRADGAAALGGH